MRHHATYSLPLSGIYRRSSSSRPSPLVVAGPRRSDRAARSKVRGTFASPRFPTTRPPTSPRSSTGHDADDDDVRSRRTRRRQPAFRRRTRCRARRRASCLTRFVDLLFSRFNALDPDGQHVVRIAAGIGLHVPCAWLANASELSPADCRAAHARGRRRRVDRIGRPPRLRVRALAVARRDPRRVAARRTHRAARGRRKRGSSNTRLQTTNLTSSRNSDAIGMRPKFPTKPCSGPAPPPTRPAGATRSLRRSRCTAGHCFGGIRCPIPKPSPANARPVAP